MGNHCCAMHVNIEVANANQERARGILASGQFAEFYKLEDSARVIRSAHWWSIKECTRISDDKMFHVKVINNARKNEYGGYGDVCNEVVMQQALKHENIVAFVEWFEEEDHTYLVFEAVNTYLQGKSLGESRFYEVTAGIALTETQVCHLMTQILKGLTYLHDEKYICHRNLYEHALFLEGDLHNDLAKSVVKIGCFNHAINAPDEALPLKSTAMPVSTKEDFGSRLFHSAPEMVPTKKGATPSYSTKADLWSLGIICYSMLTGKIPEYDAASPCTLEKIAKSRETISQAIADGQLEAMKPGGKPLSEPCIDFVKQLLNEDQAKRLNLNQLCEHSFIKGREKVLNRAMSHHRT